MPSWMDRSREVPGRLKIIKDVLTDQESYATTLMLVLVDQFQLEPFGTRIVDGKPVYGPPWLPETVQQCLEETFDLRLPPLVLDRLMAAIVLKTSNIFYADVQRFIELCNVLSGSLADAETFDAASGIECAWSVTESMLIEPPDVGPTGEIFDASIKAYVEAMLRSEGYRRVPAPLEPAVAPGYVQRNAYAEASPTTANAEEDFATKTEQDTDRIVMEMLSELITQIEKLSWIPGAVKIRDTIGDIMDELEKELTRVEKSQSPFGIV